jgi:hypothetical protein
LIVPTAAQAQPQADLGAQLTRHLTTMKRSTQVIRFFEHHRWLLSDPRFAQEAHRQLARHRANLTRAQAKAAGARAALRKRTQTRRLAALRTASPRQAICAVALRVGPDDDGPERPVSRAVPDGLERAPPVRARCDRDRAGAGRPHVLRPVGTRLEPLVLQALELTASA